MPRFQPFSGHRYNQELAPLANVIAPPYDVVDDTERALLAARSPYNAIHVELPLPDEEHGLDRYEHAAHLFGAWEKAGALVRDQSPAYYAYRMSFIDEFGAKRSTNGVLGALGVDVAGGSQVLPHEQTMPKPKGDRLDLLRATRANLSPIWGLSLARGLADACIAVMTDPSPMKATDDEGIVHELWPVTEAGAIDHITSLVESIPVVIADGHHRYETARYYQEEQRSAHGDAPGTHDFVMALVVELAEDELFVQGIHRLVSGLPEDLDLFVVLEPFFEFEEAPRETSELTKAMLEKGGLGVITRSGRFIAKPRQSLIDAAEADLDSSRLDVALAALAEHELLYQHGVGHVIHAVEDGQAQVAFVLRPATVAQIAETAHSGKRMPPKTTFFHPKPRTGMVYRSLA